MEVGGVGSSLDLDLLPVSDLLLLHSPAETRQLTQSRKKGSSDSDESRRPAGVPLSARMHNHGGALQQRLLI